MIVLDSHLCKVSIDGENAGLQILLEVNN